MYVCVYVWTYVCITKSFRIYLLSRPFLQKPYTSPSFKTLLTTVYHVNIDTLADIAIAIAHQKTLSCAEYNT